MVLLSILTSEVRIHTEGGAFCLLARPSIKRDLVAGGLIVGALVVLAASVLAVPIAFWAVSAVILVLLAPSLRLSVAARRPRSLLAASCGVRSYVGVHTVTSVVPGSGRALMDELGREADDKGWTLVLDAANESLASYYANLGYIGLCDPVPMPWAERAVRMMRAPARDRGGD